MPNEARNKGSASSHSPLDIYHTIVESMTELIYWEGIKSYVKYTKLPYYILFY